MGKRGPKKQSPEHHFWKRVKFERGHWIWTGSTNRSGNPRFTIVGKEKGKATTVMCHRFAFELKHGFKPESIQLTRQCDEPRCVNPDHFNGDREPQNKQRDDEIRFKFEQYTKWRVYNLCNLAKEYGITRQRIHQIVNSSH